MKVTYSKKVTKRSTIASTIIVVTLCLIFTVVGILLLYFDNAKKERCTESATATIIENKTVKSTHRSKGRKRTSTTYAPVFRYVYNGLEYTVTSSSSSNPPAFSVGEVTQIYINPYEPTEIYVPAEKTVKILAVMFIVIGTFSAVVVLIVGVKQIRNNETESETEWIE